MKFYPNEIDDAYSAEKVVWQKLKIAFKDDPGVAFHRYQLFDKYGNLEREIDILIVHPQMGLWIIECKGCYIDNIKSITGAEWRMRNWYEDTMKPLIQAQDQMFGIKKRLKKELNFGNLLFFNFKVALPFINYDEWEKSTFYKLINIQNTVLIADDLIPIIFKSKLIQQIGNRQQKLTKEQWRMLIDSLCATNQTLFDKPVEPQYCSVKGR